MGHTGRIAENGFFALTGYRECPPDNTSTTTTHYTSTMSTSHIPVYYENQLCGSITLAEFMSQPRYDGLSAMNLMCLTKKELIAIYLLVSPDPFGVSAMTKPYLLYRILGAYWRLQGAVAWERAAISEIHDVYLFKK